MLEYSLSAHQQCNQQMQKIQQPALLPVQLESVSTNSKNTDRGGANPDSNDTESIR